MSPWRLLCYTTIKKRTDRGDTLVEVLISMSVIGFILASTFVTANQSSTNIRDSQEHAEATAILQGQVESLRPLATGTASAIYGNNIFCTDSAGTVQTGFQYGTIPSLTNDSWSMYPAACQNAGGRYNLSVAYDNTTQVFTLRARWDRLSHGRDEAIFFYKIQPLASTPPAGGVDTTHITRSINISAYTTSDQFINSAALQGIIAGHSIPYLRIPYRSGWTDPQLLQMIGAVKNAGATPLVIVPGPCPNFQTEDDHMLTLVDQVFTSGSYYAEYGNEDDLSCNGGAGISAGAYAAGWNRDVPILKANHPRTLFIGPVNYQYNGPYVQTFMQLANPHPDAVSWHEFACAAASSDATCLGNISNWANHASDMQARMNTVGYSVPVWITEWNLDSADESRYQAPFIQTWTAQALSEWATLVTNGQISVTMIYTMENHGNFNGSCSGFQLFCSDNSLTLQGQTFMTGI